MLGNMKEPGLDPSRAKIALASRATRGSAFSMFVDVLAQDAVRSLLARSQRRRAETADAPKSVRRGARSSPVVTAAHAASSATPEPSVAVTSTARASEQLQRDLFD